VTQRCVTAATGSTLARDRTCRTDGEAIWSYALLIAVRAGSIVYVLDLAESPSRRPAP